MTSALLIIRSTVRKESFHQPQAQQFESEFRLMKLAKKKEKSLEILYSFSVFGAVEQKPLREVGTHQMGQIF